MDLGGRWCRRASLHVTTSILRLDLFGVDVLDSLMTFCLCLHNKLIAQESKSHLPSFSRCYHFGDN